MSLSDGVKDKVECNIKVVARFKGQIDNEKGDDVRDQIIIEEPGLIKFKGKDDAVKREFGMDHIFSSDVVQEQLYLDSLKPMFQDFINGYNCSTLVYGKTGSGKTYTLSGEEDSLLHSEASRLSVGVIPRVLEELFDHLSCNNIDHVVKCSYVEIYNEELKDLLVDQHNSLLSASIKKLRIVDSGSPNVKNGANSNCNTRDNSPLTSSKSIPTAIIRKKMGRQSLTALKQANTLSISRSNSFNEYSPQRHIQEKTGAPYIQNLEEFHITNAKEGIQLLHRGLKNRQIASSKNQKYSSRASTIFTIVLYKEEEGEIFRVSKWNFVDLAGAEHSHKIEGTNQRFKDINIINQGIQNLNKIVNSLHEKESVIPFKDSKLTYLIKDTLEGNSKSIFILTLRFNKDSLDEMIETLEFGNKVRSLKCYPLLGPSINKETLIKSISNELAKVKSDLLSTKSKEGVYMSHEHYDVLTKDLDKHKVEIMDLKKVIDELNEQSTTLRKDKRAFEEVNEVQRIKLQSMRDSVSMMYTNIEKQQRREHDLINSTDKLKETVNNMNVTIARYTDRESSVQTQMKTLFNEELSKLKSMLLKNLRQFEKNELIDNLEIENNLNKAHEEIKQILQISENEIDSLFLDCIKKMSEESPKLFSSFIQDVSRLENSTSENYNNLAELLSDVSEEFNNLKQYINEKFFKNNHEELLKTYVNKTYHQVQKSSDDFLLKFNDLLESYLEGNKSVLLQNIKSATSEVIENEMNHFIPQKEKWEKSIELIEKSKHSSNEFKTKNRVIVGKLQDTLKGTSESLFDTLSEMKSKINELQKAANIIENNEVVTEEFISIMKKNGILKDTLNINMTSTEESIVAFDKLDDSIRNVFKNEIDTNITGYQSILKEIFDQLDQQRLTPNMRNRKSPVRQSVSPSRTSPQIQSLMNSDLLQFNEARSFAVKHSLDKAHDEDKIDEGSSKKRVHRA
ncbi:hypothetical protein Kpol_1045p73 [Vanderwaltozyma polyspora DSM 70294]|uniref:Kinesin motor domain-containing protein n=1 Tax=Vanderwaltozyma polyspora (strain ATCC 22028 / DSM 70294 / BCRC 21397 / CBS 2163 / NBRC 10782 / NRRL Y-8283 / UCD 57-17) TaxID=436907 RepID=A7TI79_VANPO|nr:uncharacterized protein Kpol_1045p73 [Vanderwaltozyma polyspora DSM 70294]EDO18086.1 hypothetical protein Kpol_1045p73 [Vanderwaltozyma polyspora DSM 70294]